jgi:hypothetical protein
MQETMNDRFARWFKGDEAACEFAAKLWTAAQEWDDLEDEGKCENHNALMSWLAFGKEYTPYFAERAHVLRPVFLTTYLQWRAANVLERGDKSDVAKAYMLRASLYSMWHVMAWIAGGDDWAAEVGPEIYRSYGETPEELWREFN